MREHEALHAGIRARFPAYRVGLLDVESALEIRAHLRACASCRAAFEPFAELSSEEEDGRVGHVPLALLASWDRTPASLPAAERALLEAHLAQCARCAEGLSFSRGMRATPPRTRWRSRFGLAAGGAAALVATLLVVALQDTAPVRAPDPSALPPPHRPSPAPPAVDGVAPPIAPTSARRAAVVQLGHATRGAAGQVVQVPVGTTALPLRVPPLLGVGPAARIRIDVTGPGGATYGHAELEHRVLFGEAAAPAVEASAPDGGALPAGHYDVRVVSDAPDPALPGSFEQADYGFDLRWLPDPAAP